MRARRSLVLATVIAIAGAAVGTSVSTSAATRFPVRAAGPGSWVQLSSGAGVGNIDAPDVQRFGKALQVIWTQGSGTDTALRTRLLAADGSTASTVRTVVTWASVNELPAVIADAGRRVIVFAGLRSTDTSDPYASGATYYATSTDGLTWELGPGTLSKSTSAYASYGSDATDAAGTPIAVFTSGTANDISFHVGFDTNPATNPDGQTQHLQGCCAYYAGTGFSPASGQAWTAWYSNTDQETEGIYTQKIYPTAGARLHAPRSATSYGGSTSSIAPIQRVGVVAAGGGLWTAYGVGYPSQQTIALWRVDGGGQPLLLNRHHEVGSIGLAAAPGGRLWVFWAHKYTGQLEAVRTNRSGTRFGRVCTLRSPHGTDQIWETAGDGANGRLDLVVNAGSGSGEQVSSTQVLPCLSGRVSPKTVAPGDSVTITVTDAGDPVDNATVRYAGTTKHTDAHGKATFKVAKGTSTGRHRITFGHGGYTGGSVSFRVS